MVERVVTRKYKCFLNKLLFIHLTTIYRVVNVHYKVLNRSLCICTVMRTQCRNKAN